MCVTVGFCRQTSSWETHYTASMLGAKQQVHRVAGTGRRTPVAHPAVLSSVSSAAPVRISKRSIVPKMNAAESTGPAKHAESNDPTCVRQDLVNLSCTQLHGNVLCSCFSAVKQPSQPCHESAWLHAGHASLHTTVMNMNPQSAASGHSQAATPCSYLAQLPPAWCRSGLLLMPLRLCCAALAFRSDGGLPRSAVVGVLGGGQLGRMMALAAVSPTPCLATQQHALAHSF